MVIEGRHDEAGVRAQLEDFVGSLLQPGARVAVSEEEHLRRQNPGLSKDEKYIN